MDLKETDFLRVRNILHDFSGIWLPDGKESLVRARLMKRIRSLKLDSFEEYFRLVDHDDEEFLNFVDVLTTNKTDFFREPRHFDFIRSEIIPGINRPVKWWSAGCSTGEEPVSCAIQLLSQSESVASRVRILATDISGSALTVAKEGVYPLERLMGLSPSRISEWFEPLEDGRYRVRPGVRSMITYSRLNLVDPWPMKGPFHVILCRNVMIYFDPPTRQQLIGRFHEILEPGGYLFLGHSESLGERNPGFESVRPAIYRKV